MTEISTEELRAKQNERLTRDEAQRLIDCRDRAQARTVKMESPKTSLHHAQHHFFERVSVVRDHELLTEALRHGRGHISHRELKGALALQESLGEILRDGDEIATLVSLEREREMIEWVNRGVGRYKPLRIHGAFLASDRLRPEQKRAVEFVLGSRDLATSICGAAGTGRRLRSRNCGAGWRKREGASFPWLPP